MKKITKALVYPVCSMFVFFLLSTRVAASSLPVAKIQFISKAILRLAEMQRNIDYKVVLVLCITAIGILVLCIWNLKMYKNVSNEHIKQYLFRQKWNDKRMCKRVRSIAKAFEKPSIMTSEKIRRKYATEAFCLNREDYFESLSNTTEIKIMQKYPGNRLFYAEVQKLNKQTNETWKEYWWLRFEDHNYYLHAVMHEDTL